MDDGEWSAREDEIMGDHLSREKNNRRNFAKAKLLAPNIHAKLKNDWEYKYARKSGDYVDMQNALQNNGFYSEWDFARYMLTFEPNNNMTEGWTRMPPIDRDRYPNKESQGLEGPFMLRNGKVVYYDSKEGSYYDPDSDFYISYEDYELMNRDRDVKYS